MTRSRPADASPPEHDFTLRREAWEEVVMERATRFSVVAMRGRGTRRRWDFESLEEAVEAARAQTGVVYAIAPTGRSIVIDRVDYDRRVAQWRAARNAQNLENQTVNTDAYVLYWNGRGPIGAAAVRLASAAEAERYLSAVLPGDYNGYVLADESGLGDRQVFSGATLSLVYEALTGTAVKKFESIEVARRRVFRAVVERYGKEPYASADPAPRPSPKEKPVTQRPAPAAAAEAPRKRGRAPRFGDADVVVLICDGNPKKPGKDNHARFAAMMKKMRDGRTTVGEAVAAGVTLGDLGYDVTHGFIRVDPAGA